MKTFLDLSELVVKNTYGTITRLVFETVFFTRESFMCSLEKLQSKQLKQLREIGR